MAEIENYNKHKDKIHEHEVNQALEMKEDKIKIGTHAASQLQINEIAKKIVKVQWNIEILRQGQNLGENQRNDMLTLKYFHHDVNNLL